MSFQFQRLTSVATDPGTGLRKLHRKLLHSKAHIKCLKMKFDKVFVVFLLIFVAIWRTMDQYILSDGHFLYKEISGGNTCYQTVEARSKIEVSIQCKNDPICSYVTTTSNGSFLLCNSSTVEDVEDVSHDGMSYQLLDITTLSIKTTEIPFPGTFYLSES